MITLKFTWKHGFGTHCTYLVITCFGNIRTDAKPSDLVLLLVGGESDWGPLTSSSLCQEPRNEKMGQRREERRAELSALSGNQGGMVGTLGPWTHRMTVESKSYYYERIAKTDY